MKSASSLEAGRLPSTSQHCTSAHEKHHALSKLIQACTWPKVGVEAAPKLGVEAAPKAGADPPPKAPNAPPELAPKLRPVEAALDAGAADAPNNGVLIPPDPPPATATRFRDLADSQLG